MAGACKSEWKTAVGPANESVPGMTRVASHAHPGSESVDRIQHDDEQDYETRANLVIDGSRGKARLAAWWARRICADLFLRIGYSAGPPSSPELI